MTSHPAVSSDAAELQARADELLWYHSIDVAPGVATHGWWDLRHALPLLPFPDVKGKRCLDIGTWDGFYAFEMEKRGAAEVIAIDVPDLALIDYPPEVHHDPRFRDFDKTHEEKQRRSKGFDLLSEVFNSKVQWQGVNVYDLDPAVHGTFDVAIMGSLLVHLRDPVRALDAVRSVVAPDGQFLSADFIHPVVNALSFGRPAFHLRGRGTDFQWWLASEAGLRQLLWVGGFEIDAESKRFLLRPGDTVKPDQLSLRNRILDVYRYAYSGDRTRGGHLHRGFLTHPRY